MENKEQAAFPNNYPVETSICPGLTKRELIAAMMAQGLVSNAKAGNLAEENGVDKSQAIIARASIMLADELLSQLKAENK